VPDVPAVLGGGGGRHLGLRAAAARWVLALGSPLADEQAEEEGGGDGGGDRPEEGCGGGEGCEGEAEVGLVLCVHGA
jgi:hypothetical protein